MPYIDEDARQRLDTGAMPTNPGELNYAITRLIDAYVSEKGALRYAHLNEAIGVLECAKLELYRRVVAPYEDDKMAAAGDVYARRGPGTTDAP